MSKLVKLALIIVILATITIAKPNQVETTQVQQEPNSVPATESQQGKTFDDKEPATDQLPIEDEIKQADISLAKEQLRTELHENRANDLKCALEIIVVAFIVFIGYAIFRREKEYKEVLKETKGALTEIRDAGKEARVSADKARDWEDKAKEKFNQIDEKVNKKLQLIEEQGNKIGAETENQRRISELWNKGNDAYNEKDYDTAIKIWQKIDEKYKLKSRPFFNNWGSSLLNLAKQRTGDEKKTLLLEAAEKYKKAENFTRGIAAYNLASIYSLLDRENECKEWLKVAKETGRMLPKAKFVQDYDFEKMWDKEWFTLFKEDLP